MKTLIEKSTLFRSGCLAFALWTFGLAASGVAVAPRAVDAQAVYKWIDKDGNVHFGDQPSPKVNATRLTSLPSGSSSIDPHPVAETKKLAEDAQKCQDMRDKLTTYKAASSVTETDALGNTHEFSEEERQKLIGLTTQKIQESCGGGT